MTFIDQRRSHVAASISSARLRHRDNRVETFVLVDVDGAEVNARFPASLISDRPEYLVFDPNDLHFFEPVSGNTLRTEPARILEHQGV